MASKNLYLASVGPMSYDDATYYALNTDGQLYVGAPPSIPQNVIRQSDLATLSVTSVSNSDGTLTISPTVGNVVAAITFPLTLSADFTTEYNGITLRNFHQGGYGTGFSLYSTETTFATSTIEAGRIYLVGESNWASLANVSSGLSFWNISGGTIAEKLRITNAGYLKVLLATLLLLTSGSAPALGEATLVAGTKAVLSDLITANSRVLLTRKTSGGTIGTAITYTLQTSAPKGFTITSDSVLDTSVFTWMIIEGF